MTGATRGIGRATALRFAQRGADVVLVARDERRLDALRLEARAANNDRVFWVRADFASLASVRGAAEEIAHRWPAIHVLVNNAGVNSARRAASADGHEMTYAVNHLAPFLLTTLLVPALARAAPSRIVEVTSIFAHLGRVDFDDPMFARRRYNSTSAYTQSKLANAMSSIELTGASAPARIDAASAVRGTISGSRRSVRGRRSRPRSDANIERRGARSGTA